MTRAHDTHQKQAFHNIKAQIEMQDSSSMSITADYLPAESDPVDEKGRIIDSVFARKIVNDIQGQPVSILSVKLVNRKNEPPQPYNLLALQADSAGLWNYKPKKVLEITQRLRDRYKAITYNRSDCRFLNDERHSEALGLLKALSSAFGEMAEYANPNIKSKNFNSKKVGAHHAIIPTMNVPDLKKLSEDERRIYELITKLYIAQFYPPAKFTTTKT